MNGEEKKISSGKRTKSLTLTRRKGGTDGSERRFGLKSRKGAKRGQRKQTLNTKLGPKEGKDKKKRVDENRCDRNQTQTHKRETKGVCWGDYKGNGKKPHRQKWIGGKGGSARKKRRKHSCGNCQKGQGNPT